MNLPSEIKENNRSIDYIINIYISYIFIWLHIARYNVEICRLEVNVVRSIIQFPHDELEVFLLWYLMGFQCSFTKNSAKECNSILK